MKCRLIAAALWALASSVHADFGLQVRPEALVWPASAAECDDDRRSAGWSMSECLGARNARDIFERLLKASRGLPEYRSDWQEPKLYFVDLDEINAEYHWKRHLLGVFKGTVRKSDKLIWAALSHELGHWLQEMRGMAISPLLPSDGLWWKGKRYTSRQTEAQADLYGLHIALLAGFPKQAWIDGLAQAWGCDHIGDVKSNQEHPLPRDRYANIIGLSEIGVLADRNDMKVDAPPAGPMDWFDRIKNDGALVDQKPLTPERARELCRGLFDGLDGDGETAAGSAET